MPHVEESIAEIGRALDELGMAGVVMNTTVMGRALVDPYFDRSSPNSTGTTPCCTCTQQGIPPVRP
jgi:hypothetical protein